MTSDSNGADLGLVGLGTMGQALALNVLDSGFSLAAWNLEGAVTDAFVAEAGDTPVRGASDLRELVASLAAPRKILLMITAGKPVDFVLGDLVPLLAPGDVVIDGGNSAPADTTRRGAELAAKGLHFVGMGVSGGEDGARHGPSLMPGGSPEAYAALAPILEAIAAKTEAGPCVTHVGPGAAGHFVKMVHNGIEYAEMQLLAEGYDLLGRGLGLTAAELGDVHARWNEGPLESFLVELTARIFRTRDAETGEPLVERVLDRAGQKGTGRWTEEAALELGVPAPTIAAAITARVVSALKERRERAATVLGGTARPFEDVDRGQVIADVEQAIVAGRIAAWTQGMDIIAAASRENEWGVDLSEVARIWKGGCIIRAAMIDLFRRAWECDSSLDQLVLDPEVAGVVANAEGSWRRITAQAIGLGIPVPAMVSALAWFDALRTPRLPQSLVQAQRDAFGAHGFERTDREGSFHSEWDG